MRTVWKKLEPGTYLNITLPFDISISFSPSLKYVHYIYLLHKKWRIRRSLNLLSSLKGSANPLYGIKGLYCRTLCRRGCECISIIKGMMKSDSIAGRWWITWLSFQSQMTQAGASPCDGWPCTCIKQEIAKFMPARDYSGILRIGVCKWHLHTNINCK